MRRLLMIILLSACATGQIRGTLPTSDSERDQAARRIWSAIGGERPIPRIIWQTKLECNNGTGVKIVSGDCVPGYYQRAGHFMELAMPPGVHPCRTALPHEMAHAALPRSRPEGHPELEAMEVRAREACRDPR